MRSVVDGVNLLVVDDLEMDRCIIDKLLSEHYNIKFATNGHEAMEILSSEVVDVVLTDIVMPKMDGIELVQEIRKNPDWDKIGILVATSHKEDMEKKALEIGADDFISKPYSPFVLKRRIENIWAKLKMGEALRIAQEANKAKSEFLSAMSHDIRTPMNAIIGMTEIALDDKDNKEQVIDSLYTINNSSHQLLNLINDILDISRIESGKMKLSKKTFRHSKEFGKQVDSVAALMQQKNLTFNYSLNVEHDYCYGDSNLTERIIDNILGNAIKFTPAGGTIDFNVKEKQSNDSKFRKYEFTISDDGIGMDETTVSNIFEPFYRDEKFMNSNVEGSGLGMSIVKNAVDLTGGTIDVESKLNEGTTFTVELSFEVIDEDYYKDNNSDKYVEYNLDNINVLLVEDHPVNQKVAKKILEKAGVIVDVACNGKEATIKMNEGGFDKYDIVLMDIQMPIMNGYEATRTIRDIKHSKAQDIPIVAMTANAFGEDIKKCLDAGMNAHISKPIEPKHMLEVIGKFTSSPLKEGSMKWEQKVLIVDDAEINIDVLESAINDDYLVLKARDGVEALEVIKENPDIVAVLTDIQMPNMNGLQLIKKIRSNRLYDHIAVLANTQYGDVAQEETLLNAGADDFLYKPTTPLIVSHRLKNVLKNYIYK